MPRPSLPNLVGRPDVRPPEIDERQRRKFAELLGQQSNTLEQIAPDWADALAHLVAGYRATRDISTTTTIENNRVVLRRLYGRARGKLYLEAVDLLINERSGVDHVVFYELRDLAQRVIQGDNEARDQLAQAARSLDEDYGRKARVIPQVEQLRHFCGILRRFFCHFAAPSHHEQRYLHRFAREVLDFAGVEHGFDAHPERLAEYLDTEVSRLG